MPRNVTPNNGDIRVLAYFQDFFFSLRAHRGGKMTPRVERSRYRFAIL